MSLLFDLLFPKLFFTSEQNRTEFFLFEVCRSGEGERESDKMRPLSGALPLHSPRRLVPLFVLVWFASCSSWLECANGSALEIRGAKLQGFVVRDRVDLYSSNGACLTGTFAGNYYATFAAFSYENFPNKFLLQSMEVEFYNGDSNLELGQSFSFSVKGFEGDLNDLSGPAAYNIFSVGQTYANVEVSKMTPTGPFSEIDSNCERRFCSFSYTRKYSFHHWRISQPKWRELQFPWSCRDSD